MVRLLLIAVQPFGAVAVTEYGPIMLTLIVAVVSPVDQRRAVTDDVAVSVRVGCAQVRVKLAADILTVGRVLSSTMLRLLLTALHPLPSDTVTE